MSTVYYLALVILIALFVTFVIQVSEKFGFRDRAIGLFDGLLKQMLECDFCLGFWTAAAACLIVAIITGYWTAITVPIFSAPITRYFLN